MVTAPALPFAKVEAMAFEQVVVAAVVPREEVVAAACVECVVSRVQVIAAAVAVPGGAAADGDDDTAAAQVVPVRANQVVARGSCRVTSVAPRRGSRPGPVVPRWCCCWTGSFRLSRRRLSAVGGQGRASIRGHGLRPSCYLPELSRG